MDLLATANSAQDVKNKQEQEKVIQATEANIDAKTKQVEEQTKALSLQNAIDEEVKPVKSAIIKTAKSFGETLSTPFTGTATGNSASDQGDTHGDTNVVVLGRREMRDGRYAKPIKGGFYRDSFGGKYGIYDSDGNKLSPRQIDDLRKRGIIK